MTQKVWRCAAVGSGSPGLSGHAVNVFHFQCDNATATVQAAVDAIKDWYTAIAGNMPSSGSTVIGDRVVAFDPANPHLPGEVAATTPRTVAMSGGGSVLPAQVCVVYSWRTGLSGRSLRGRTYIGPMIASVFSSTTGEFTTTAQAAWQSAATAFVTAINGLTSTSLLLYSPKLGTTQKILSASVGVVPGTQRGRIR